VFLNFKKKKKNFFNILIGVFLGGGGGGGGGVNWNENTWNGFLARFNYLFSFQNCWNGSLCHSMNSVIWRRMNSMNTMKKLSIIW